MIDQYRADELLRVASATLAEWKKIGGSGRLTAKGKKIVMELDGAAVCAQCGRVQCEHTKQQRPQS